MTSKWMIFMLIFLILKSNAVRRGGTSKSRVGAYSYSAGNLHNESPQDPGRAILAIIFMILSCGCGIGWKIYRCYRKDKRGKFLQTRVPYPNNLSTSSNIRLNEINLPTKRSTLVSLSVESLQEHTSEKEDKCSIIVPLEDINKPARTDWISTLL